MLKRSLNHNSEGFTDTAIIGITHDGSFYQKPYITSTDHWQNLPMRFQSLLLIQQKPCLPDHQ